MRSARTLALSGVLLASPALGAQQPGDLVSFGGIRVPSCPAAADPEYGLVKEKAIPIGGGPLYMAARQQRYLSLLRGPQGEQVRVVGGVGSSPLLTGNDAGTIIDQYSVVYDGPNGPVTTSVFMDAYHLAAPKVPAGFTCGGPLASGVRMPPVDPFKAGPSTIALAIELGSKSDIQLPRLDPAASRGYVLDQFAMIALRARAAAASGSPLDPARPPKDLEPLGITVLAYPVACGERTVAPQSIDMTGTQGPVPRRTAAEVLRDGEIANVFPGVAAPAGSIAIRFRQAQPTQIQITYVEGCDGGPAAITLPVTIEPAKLAHSSLATLPPGTVDEDPTIYLQAVIDPEGRFARPEYLGGPRALLPTALETIGQWRATPLRVNGTPSIFPVVLQVIFRPN